MKKIKLKFLLTIFSGLISCVIVTGQVDPSQITPNENDGVFLKTVDTLFLGSDTLFYYTPIHEDSLGFFIDSVTTSLDTITIHQGSNQFKIPDAVLYDYFLANNTGDFQIRLSINGAEDGGPIQYLPGVPSTHTDGRSVLHMSTSPPSGVSPSNYFEVSPNRYLYWKDQVHTSVTINGEFPSSDDVIVFAVNNPSSGSVSNVIHVDNTMKIDWNVFQGDTFFMRVDTNVIATQSDLTNVNVNDNDSDPTNELDTMFNFDGSILVDGGTVQTDTALISSLINSNVEDYDDLINKPIVRGVWNYHENELMIGTSSNLSSTFGVLGTMEFNYPTVGTVNFISGTNNGDLITTGSNNVIYGSSNIRGANATYNFCSGILNANSSTTVSNSIMNGEGNARAATQVNTSLISGNYNVEDAEDVRFSNILGYRNYRDNTGDVESSLVVGYLNGSGTTSVDLDQATVVGLQNCYSHTDNVTALTALGIYNARNATTVNNGIYIGQSNGRFNSGPLNHSILMGFEQGYSSGVREANPYRLAIGMYRNTPLLYGEFDNDYFEVNGSMQVVDSLGVGTATPGASLHVLGDLIATDLTGLTPRGLIAKDDNNQFVDATDELVQDAAFTSTFLTPLLYDDANNTVEIDFQTISTDAIPEGDEVIMTQDISLNYSNEAVTIQNIWDNAPSNTLTEEEVEDFAFNGTLTANGLLYDDANNRIEQNFQQVTVDAIDGEDVMIRQDFSQSRMERNTIDDLLDYIKLNTIQGIGRRSSTTNLTVPASGEVAVPFTSTSFGQGSVGFTYTNSLNNASSTTAYFRVTLLLEVDGDDGAEFDVILRPHNSTTTNYEVFELVKNGTGNETFNLTTEIELDFNDSVRAMVVNRGSGTSDIDFVNDFSHMTLTHLTYKE